MANSADPDLDLHCLQNSVYPYPGSAGQGLIKIIKKKKEML